MSEDLSRSIGRLEGKMDSLILQLTEHIKKDEKAWDKVVSMEGKILWFSGAFAAAGFFITMILKKIGLVA